jgi:hypothetical protein
MFSKRILLAGLLSLSAPAALLAQTQTLDGVSRISRSAISPIYAGNEVKGYIMYAKGDKADKKNDNYLLDFYDQDLAKVSSITVQKPSGRYYLLGDSFNGSAFGLYFFNMKEGTLEIETYDTSLKKLGTKVISEMSKVDKMKVQQVLQQKSSGAEEQAFSDMELFPVPGYGFVRNSYEGMMKGFTLQMYDNQLNEKWTLSSEPKSKYYESINISEANDKYILATIMRRDGMFSKKLESFFLVIDAATGKKIMDLPVEAAATEQLSLSSFTFDAPKHEFVAMGEFYKLDDKPFVNKSQGFYLKRFSETGQPVMSKNYGWQNEVRAAMPAAALPSLEEGYVNYAQSIVRGANGKTYIVAEQYKIIADGLGIAAQMMGGRGVSVSKGKIANMFVFALDPTYKLTDVKFYPKDESRAIVPPGGGFMGAGILGMYFKSSGQFDYQFMQKNDANSQFNAVYINYDKEKGEQTKKIIGNLAFGDNGQFKLDKIDMTSNATASFLYPAKPGYLMMVEYLKKDKKVGMKLVKVNI